MSKNKKGGKEEKIENVFTDAEREALEHLYLYFCFKITGN
jgi:hypothetical protein